MWKVNGLYVGFALGSAAYLAFSLISRIKSKRKTLDEENQNLLNLLFAVASEQARKEGTKHNGISCNNCGQMPIKGVRYKCANCHDFDLCGSCESLEPHNNLHVFIKIKIPLAPFTNPNRKILDVLYPGNVDRFRTFDLSEISNLDETLHFDRTEILSLSEQFRAYSTIHNDRTGITWETFQKSVGDVSDNLLIKRLFHVYDADGDGLISFSDMLSGLSVFLRGTIDEKIHFTFKGLDLNGDGTLSREEVTLFLYSYYSASIFMLEDLVNSVDNGLVTDFDANESKPVSAAFAIPRCSAFESIESKIDPAIVAHRVTHAAVRQIVDRIFQNTKENDSMSKQEFKSFISEDSTILNWFESLGSIF